MVAFRYESFQGLNSAALWTSKHLGTASASFTYGSANGRFGGKSMRATAVNISANAIYDAVATAYAGGAWRSTALNPSEVALVTFKDGTTEHITFSVTATGIINIRRGGAGGTLLASSAAGAVVTNEFAFWEFRATINDTTGVAEVKKNGVVVATFSGDTQNGAGAQSDNILFYSGSNGTIDWADIYYGGTGGYLGDGYVECLFPTGAGTTTQFTRGGADSGANWSQVEETPPNDDTDYVTSGTVNNKDTYAHGDLATAGATIHGVQIVMRAKKSAAGSSSLKSVVRLSGGTEEDSAARALSTTYETLTDVRTTKPGGGAFAVADVNGAEFGPKVG